jgi:FXSXX-COOH protein
MITIEDEELISEVRDLRDVPLAGVGGPGEKVLEGNLRRIVPDCTRMPAVPVAAFQNSI